MNCKKFIVLYFLIGSIGISLYGQTPWDAIFMGKNELCTAIIYDESQWTQYWEGSTLISNENIGRFRRQTINTMLSYGITDFLDATLMLPYIQTSSSQGQLAGVGGFQDVSATIKMRFFKKEQGVMEWDFIGVAGFTTPVSNYLSDYMPFSIGLGATEVSGRLTTEIRYDKTYYVRLSGGHHWRGATQIERAYYFDNGSAYSEFMNVPNAISAHSAIGLLLLEGRLRTELTYWGTWCTSGDDIRRWLRPQPTNKFEFQQIGFFGQYYFKNIRVLSVVAYCNQIFTGRNIGMATNVSLGATYQFGL